jgi:CubicO group peptidase (beta-lactamase class C family)
LSGCAETERIEQLRRDFSTRPRRFGLKSPCSLYHSDGIYPYRLLRRLSIATAVLLGIVVFPQHIEAQGLSYEFALFERYLEAFRMEASIPGISATIAQNGVVVWERGFGRRNVESAAPATPDTPYQIGRLSQAFGATLLLRKCVDQEDAELEDPVALRSQIFPEPQTTLRQLLSHTAPGGGGYEYAPQRFASLTPVIERCAQRRYSAVLASEIFDRFAMLDSAPDVFLGAPPDEFDAAHRARYAGVAARMAVPYRIASGRPQRNTELVARRVDASDGIVTSVRDLVRFDNALASDALLAQSTRNRAWTQAYDGTTPLPTGLGWFVQNYHDEPIVWQFGTIRGGASALIVKAPNRGLTYVLLANSDGLTAPFALESGDVTSSIFATLFLRLFVP